MSRWTKYRPPALVIGITLICGLHAQAHHSFADTYSSEKVTIQGTVIEFLFRNPHSAILLETRGDNGQTITWAAEWGTAGQLSRQGIEKELFEPGDHLIISGNPSRNPSDHRLRISEITRPSDEWKWKASY